MACGLGLDPVMACGVATTCAEAASEDTERARTERAEMANFFIGKAPCALVRYDERNPKRLSVEREKSAFLCELLAAFGTLRDGREIWPDRTVVRASERLP
jgi:hypothetical protein